MYASELYKRIIEFGKRKDNPHKLNAELTETYDKLTMEEKLKKTIPYDLLPISFWPAAMNDLHRKDIRVVDNVGIFDTYQITKKDQMIVNGRVYEITPEDSTEITIENPHGYSLAEFKEFYVWMTFKDGKCNFFFVNDNDAPDLITNISFPIGFTGENDGVFGFINFFRGVIIEDVVINENINRNNNGSMAPIIGGDYLNGIDSSETWYKDLI